MAIATCCLLLGATLAHAASPKLAKELQGRGSSEPVNVIIQFHQTPTAAHHQKVAQRGGTLARELKLVKAGAYSVPASALAALADDPEVAYIAPDRPVSGTAVNNGQTLDYHTAAINAAYGSGLGLDGTGIGVAVIDSGITNVPDLDKRVVYSQNFVGAGGGSADDTYGHGIHVSGIIAGSGKNSMGPGYFYKFQGLAPNVNLINLRVLDQNGQGRDSQVIAAIQQAIKLKAKYNIRILNLSLGRPVYESYTLDPLCQAVEQAWNAGIVVVVAAGNEGRNNSANNNGYGTITAPGNDPYVITVGAMRTMGTPDRSDDVIASYSSKGPTLYDHVVKPDLVAPGNEIISLYATPSPGIPALTLATTYPGDEVSTALYKNGAASKSTSYFILSGTSMAAPMVSGAAALMLQQSPALTPDQVKARLMKTAYKNLVPFSSATDPTTGVTYQEQADIFTVGAGYLDIQAALSNRDLAPAVVGSALSPTATQDDQGNIVLVSADPAIWGTSVMWGNSVTWGTSVLWGTNTLGQSVLWGTSVCWGNSATQGYSVLWGTASTLAQSVLWGTTNTLTQSVLWGSSSISAMSSVSGQADSISVYGEN